MSNLVFGPVPSRRLGRSLGLDLVPFKTCTYDCIYCQLGRTTEKTVERKPWVPIDDALDQLREKLATRPDYVTLSGSGEPTLHAQIGEVIDRVKTISDVPVAVLTNGSLLWEEELRRQLLDADLVIPSLDATTEEMFRIVNRPHKAITFERMLDGLVAFGDAFQGEYWLEILLLGRLTDTDQQAARLAACAKRIRPTRIQLNTATRPPAESTAVAVPVERLDELAPRFRPPAQVISEYRGTGQKPEGRADRERILQLVRRRPCTLEDIAAGLGMHPAEVTKHTRQLTGEKRLSQTRSTGRLYYRIS